MRSKMHQLEGELIRYLDDGTSAVHVLSGLPGVGKSTCLSLCFNVAMARRTAWTLILRAVATPDGDVWSSILTNALADNFSLFADMRRRCIAPNVADLPLNELAYLGVARKFVEDPCEVNLKELFRLHARRVIPECRVVVLIDQWNLISKDDVLGKARSGGAGYPGFFLYAPSGTWNSQRCDRAPPDVTLPISPLTVEEASDIVRYCACVERDMSGLQDVVRKIGGSVRLLLAWTEMTSAAFETFAKRDAQQRYLAAMEKAERDGFDREIRSAMFTWFRCGYEIPDAMADHLHGYGLWDTERQAPANDYMLHVMRCNVDVVSESPARVVEMIHFFGGNESVLGAVLERALARSITRNRRVSVRAEDGTIRDVLLRSVWEWESFADIRRVPEGTPPMLIILPPRFPVVDFVGVWNNRIWAIQVSVSKYSQHGKQATDLFTASVNVPALGESCTVYDTLRWICGPCLKLPKITRKLSASKYPKRIRYVYATTHVSHSTLPLLSQWNRDVLGGMIDRSIIDAISPQETVRSPPRAMLENDDEDEDEGEDEEEEEDRMTEIRRQTTAAPAGM